MLEKITKLLSLVCEYLLYFHVTSWKVTCVYLPSLVHVCSASSIMTVTHIQGTCVPLTDGVSGVPHAVHFHRVGRDAASAQRARVARYHLHLHQRHRESQGGELSPLPLSSASLCKKCNGLW